MIGPSAPYPLHPDVEAMYHRDKVAPPAEPFPAPLITSEDGVDGPLKTAVADLERMAKVFGWSGRITYAKGWVMNQYGRPGAEPRGNLAVRLARGRERAVATYQEGSSSWTWDMLYLLAAGQAPRKATTLAEFQAMVFGPVHGPILGGPMHGPKRPTPAQWKAMREGLW